MYKNKLQSMISKEMEAALNKQIELEAKASFLYLAMAGFFDQNGMTGGANFFYNQSEEERMHMLKIYKYINEVGGRAISPSVLEVKQDFVDVKEIMELALESERKVTKAIHELVAMSTIEKDYSTLDFLQWYVAEQREEEILMQTILDRINLIGDGPGSLYYIDKELEAIDATKDKDLGE